MTNSLDEKIKLPIPSKETFACYSTDAKLDTVFDLLIVALLNQQEVITVINKRKKIDTTVASTLGLAGGFIAGFMRDLFGGSGHPLGGP